MGSSGYESILPRRIQKSVSCGCGPAGQGEHTTWDRGHCNKKNGFLFPSEVCGLRHEDRMGRSVSTCSVSFWRGDDPRLRSCMPSIGFVVHLLSNGCYIYIRVWGVCSTCAQQSM